MKGFLSGSDMRPAHFGRRQAFKETKRQHMLIRIQRAESTQLFLTKFITKSHLPKVLANIFQFSDLAFLDMVPNQAPPMFVLLETGPSWVILEQVALV